MIHNDHLGTPQKMTDASGTVVWAADYKPFGEATVTVSTITNNLRFPGQYYDAETGLNYNINRTYNTTLDRYLEADGVGIKKGTNHLYLYAYANPLQFVDPYGLLSCVYVVDSHTMSCVNNQNQSMSSTLFFSGKKDCKNNPTCSNKKDKGPLPPGTYSIMTPGYSAKHPDWMYLGDSGVDLGDRTGEFFIHPGNESKGCIVTLKSNMSDFNTISSWATQGGGGSLTVISTSDPIL
jgi:RHS repeat-associated protein